MFRRIGVAVIRAACRHQPVGKTISPVRPFFSKLFSANKEKTMEERKKIREEMNTPYFPNFKDIAANKPKADSPIPLTAKSDAKPLPSVQTSKLDGEQVEVSAESLRGKVSLVIVCFREFASTHAQPWFDKYDEVFASNSLAQRFEISVIELSAIRFVQNMFLSSANKAVTDPRRRERFLCAFGQADAVKESLAAHDRFMPNVYLVDAQGLVRWRSHGRMSEQDGQLLIDYTQSLLNELGGAAKQRR